MSPGNRGVWVVAVAALALVSFVVLDQSRTSGSRPSSVAERFVPGADRPSGARRARPQADREIPRGARRNPFLDVGGPTREAM